MRAVIALWLIASLLATGCSSLPPRPDTPPESALAAGSGGALDAVVQADVDAHPGQSGFHLVSDGVQAFALRGLSARSAARSLDVQYYIWHDDLTGRLLAAELLAAADRGVRVRVLLDDMDARGKNLALAAMAAHPNISVRLFNPFASRRGKLGLVTEMVGSFARINRRMHNKSWIADNRFAVVGGRNIGDEYFGASEAVNFNDLDLAMIGPVVAAVSDSFDKYWNSNLVWPIRSLSPAAVDPAALEQLRARARALAAEARENAWVRAMIAEDPRAGARASIASMHWTGRWQLLSDSPDKSIATDSPIEKSAVLAGLQAALAASRHQADLISPYFVPGEQGTERLVAFAGSGRRLRVLTNSLAANDVAAVHAGYSRYRDDLLAGGVQLWELKPEGRAPGISLFGSSGASLHTKAAVFDRETAFVGSFNLDPRSVSLNCEQGLLVTEPALVAELAALFTVMIGPAVSWRVERRADGRLVWSDGTRTFDGEPEAPFSRRIPVMIARLLPIEPLL